MTCADCIDTMYHPGTASNDCECSCHPDLVGTIPFGWINIPRPQPDRHKAEEAFKTHSFDRQSGKCWDCDCRAGGTLSEYPCGSPAPRVVVRSKHEKDAMAPLMKSLAVAETLEGAGGGREK